MVNMGKSSAKECMPFGAETMENDPCTDVPSRRREITMLDAGTGTRQNTSALQRKPVTKKTQESAGFFLSPIYISLILWRLEVGKNPEPSKPAVFLVTGASQGAEPAGFLAQNSAEEVQDSFSRAEHVKVFWSHSPFSIQHSVLRYCRLSVLPTPYLYLPITC